MLINGAQVPQEVLRALHAVVPGGCCTECRAGAEAHVEEVQREAGAPGTHRHEILRACDGRAGDVVEVSFEWRPDALFRMQQFYVVETDQNGRLLGQGEMKTRVKFSGEGSEGPFAVKIPSWQLMPNPLGCGIDWGRPKDKLTVSVYFDSDCVWYGLVTGIAAKHDAVVERQVIIHTLSDDAQRKILSDLAEGKFPTEHADAR